MKQGSEYARRVKRLLTQLVKKFGKPDDIEAVDPTEQLIIGILAGCTTHAKALAVYRKLRHHVVDLNELRVTPAMELAEQIGDGVPLGRQKAQRIVDALNAVRKRQDSLDMTFLKQRGRREAREYLESLDGVDRAAAASVVLFSLGGHAFPLDDLMLHILQKEELVDASADGADVQTFLERCVSAPQTPMFYELLSRYVAGKTLKVPIEQLAALLRPASAQPSPKPPVAAVNPVVVPPPVAAKSAPGAQKGAALPASKNASQSAVKTAPQPAGKLAPPAKLPAASKAPAKAVGKKAGPAERRLVEPAGKSGGNHAPAPAKSPAVRKKK